MANQLQRVGGAGLISVAVGLLLGISAANSADVVVLNCSGTVYYYNNPGMPEGNIPPSAASLDFSTRIFESPKLR